LEASGEVARIVIALLYHDVVPAGEYSKSGFSGQDADTYKFEIDEFVRHLDAINKVPERSDVSLVDDRGQSPQGSLLLTFDDGGVGAMVTADLLERRGWRGHFFITTDFIGRPEFLSHSQIRELHFRGHVIGSHSCSHPPRMSHCSPSQLSREWVESACILSDICGATIQTGSVPGGFYARCVAQTAAEAGITTLFNSEPTTRQLQVGNCAVVGRFSIQQGVTAQTAASIASGDWKPQMRQFLYWNAKKVAKRVGGNRYIAFRKMLFDRKNQKKV
jgi:peptidoglycan/xylan/chitin deacetylase (PgdA/CDA1 family)